MNTSRKPADYRFSFAVVADTHINQADMQSSSPFPVNRLANRRFEYVVDDLNRRDLAAVFHLGDVVHPVPSMEQPYADSVDRFLDQARRLEHPLHIIPGNHDVGDKRIDWGPAGTVRDSFLEAWTDRFGAHFFRVDYAEMSFVGINAQLLGSGLDMERDQERWLEACLPELAGRRLVLLSHYPPFLEHEEEPEHYDNLSRKSRKWLLDLVREYRFEALFCGHVHNFWYYRYAGCDCYLLPSTAFVRQDYGEMFRARPGREFGRNDMEKLGYLLVHVYRSGHDFEMVRCFAPDAETGNGERGSMRWVRPVNPRTNRCPALGFDLRHDWMEKTRIPPSGGLDEFRRKQVRNDYPLLALWEMGVRNLRVPLDDLLDPGRRTRMGELRHLGFMFSTYSFGIPERACLEVLRKCTGLVSGMEIIWPENRLDALDTSDLGLLEGIRVVFSPLWQGRKRNPGDVYYHVINHGVTRADLTRGDAPAGSARLPEAFSGCVFRLGVEDDVRDLITRVREFDTVNGTESIVHLRLASENPAEAPRDSSFACARIARAMLGSWLLDGPTLYCDTLTDHDRGYFPREGILDRLCNPRPAFSVIRNLHGFLDRLDSRNCRPGEEMEGQYLQIKTENRTLTLFYSETFPDPGPDIAGINLLTGEILGSPV